MVAITPDDHFKFLTLGRRMLADSCGLTAAIRLTYLLAPKRALVYRLDGRLSGNQTAELSTG